MTVPHRPNQAIELRAVWISDTHLGFAGANADPLQRFLRAVRCQRPYLVGDIVDSWALRKKRHWPQSHNNILRTVLGWRSTARA